MMSDVTSALIARLQDIVGSRHVLTTKAQTRSYCHGYRFGSGLALAVVRPGTLDEQLRAFEAIIEAGAIVIVQAANTGLTGGSTPNGTYDRPVVIINTLRISQIHIIRAGKQVICLAGATLHELERVLEPLDREPHSVIGSSCFGASVVGGICNNSGGALLRRGPAYTEYALFARATETGRVELVNHLGIRLIGTSAEILARIEAGEIDEADILDDGRAASCLDYSRKVREVDVATPARFNADPARLFEASGSAGKIMVLAVRLDTYPRDEQTSTFYIGSNEPAELEALRRGVLSTFTSLPVSAEYIHREAFDIAANYGKDLFLVIERLGTQRLPRLFALKHWLDGAASRLPFLPRHLSDRLMQAASYLFPDHLPKRMREWRDRYEHHLILKVAGQGIGEARSLLAEAFPSANGNAFECTAVEARKAFLHRFAVAGSAVRYCAIHERRVGGIIALDVALRRNEWDWFEHLPKQIDQSILKPIYYGHFFCHVFHQDYIVKRGADSADLEHQMWDILDARGAEYPAEHNVGHLYRAKESLVRHYRELDPGNHLNPGVGQTSRNHSWH